MAKKRLGRGLSDILGEVEEAYENNLNDNSGLVVELDVDSIKPNPFQPRKVFSDESLQELAASIEENGLLQPILVYENNESPNTYFLIAGERRLRASKIAKKDSIKAIVVDVKQNKLRELALIENIQRENLNPIDLAHSYRELINDYGITHEEVARRLSKSRAQITNTLRLLELSQKVQNFILDNKITQGHAKILVALPHDTQDLIADSIIGQKLSVQATEKLVKDYKNNKNSKKVGISNKGLINANSTTHLKEMCKKLQSLGICANLQKNRLIVEFSNDEEVEKFNKFLPF